MICTVANSLWLAGCVSEFARFRRASRRVAETQQALLRRILAENANTEFGRAHGFSTIHSAAEYQQRVPLRDYNAHREWMDRTAAGLSNVLTRERIRLFEPTSGSCGATKLIPYTGSLQAEFQRGIRSWIADLFLNYPELMGGQAYWSVSPVTGTNAKTSGGIPVGFDDDTSYVGGWQRRLVNSVMAVPNAVRLTSDLDSFRYRTLLHLVRSRGLRLISAWDPSYLSLLFDRLPEWGDRIAYDLAQGTFCAADGRRGGELRAALRATSPQEAHARLWPKLGLISCWADANAAGPAARLAESFPQARLQGKGLLATEGFVSFPLVNREGAALAVRSHFLEFLPVNSDRPQLAHQLERGAQYTVALTTGGGLYRYLLGDLVEVIGHIHGCPLIRFLGRQGLVSDWFGEKLSETHVSGVLRDTFGQLELVPSFAMLACETGPSPAYVLYIDSSAGDEMLELAAARIDASLRANFHYDYARRLGQLASVRPLRAHNGAAAYLAAAMRTGMKAGAVKIPALDRHDGWSSVFAHPPGIRQPGPLIPQGQLIPLASANSKL